MRTGAVGGRGRAGASTSGCRLVGVAGLAALVVAGCAGGGAGGGSTPGAGGSVSPGRTVEPPVTSVRPVRDIAGLTLPLQRYQWGEQDVRRLDQARVRLIDDCMRRFGLRYDVPMPDAGPPGRGVLDRRYGLSDRSAAARYGYGLGDRDPSRQARPQPPSLDADGATVLFGEGRSTVRGRRVPVGGCLGEANRILAGSVPPGVDLMLGQTLSFQAYESSRHDSRVVAVVDRWSACMSGHGYAYADPLAPLSDPKLRSLPADRTRQVALTDLDCKDATDLIGTWFAVESAYQDRLLEQNLAALESERRGLDAERTQAAAVLRS